MIGWILSARCPSRKLLPMRLTATLLALTLLYASPVSAQSAPDTAARDTAPDHSVVAVRALMGTLGWVSGAVAGAYIGNAIPRDPCSCDDPGLNEVVTGMAIGGALGAALVASAPKLNSRCSFVNRLGLALLGSAVGSGLGMIQFTDGSRVLTVPVFSIIGSSLSQWPC